MKENGKMETPKVEVKTEGKETFIIITAKVPKSPAKSKSGKSLLLASTEGNLNTGLKIGGKDLIVGLNAYTKVD